RIPWAAGLAGGSGNAAAALVGLNLLWGLKLPLSELALLAAELGSDVPFFLGAGSAVCRGRGERLEPVAGLAGVPMVVVRPWEGLSTASVFRACRPADQPRSSSASASALRSRCFQP